MCPAEVFLSMGAVVPSGLWDLGNTLPSFLSASSVLSRDVILDCWVSTLRIELSETLHIKYFCKNATKCVWWKNQSVFGVGPV